MMKVYSVRDSKVEAYEKPMFARTKGEMIREFQRAVNEQGSYLYNNPEDFVLFEIGEWNEEKGLIESYDAPLSIGVAIEFKKVDNK